MEGFSFRALTTVKSYQSLKFVFILGHKSRFVQSADFFSSGLRFIQQWQYSESSRVEGIAGGFSEGHF